jgi:hypothetical protein
MTAEGLFWGCEKNNGIQDSRGKVKFLTGGEVRKRTQPATRFSCSQKERLIWCNSRADGKVRMGEDHKIKTLGVFPVRLY